MKKLPNVIDKPNEYMRAFHPELFSDTIIGTPKLSKKFLEYILDTITNREEEKAFEEFCRRILQREICPNLRPMTGPTGGGDSGTDSNTYPVSDTLSGSRYWFSLVFPSEKNWAFAFSAKEKWTDKINSDIKKIVDLQRGFEHIFFVSNQFISDKSRSTKEDSLLQQYGIPVTIFDRAWLVEKTITNQHEDIVADTLGFEESFASQHRTYGPRDAARTEILNNLENRLSKLDLYNENYYAVCLDFLKAAKIARNLEKPRAMVEGLFQQASRIAEREKYLRLAIKIHYHRAWTSFWWYEDYHELVQSYTFLENYLPYVLDSYELSLYYNLYMLLKGATLRDKISNENAKIEDRLTALQSALTRLSIDPKRPNNALEAETLLLLLNLTSEIHCEKTRESVLTDLFKKIKKCFKKALFLGTFPALRFINIFTQLGEIFTEVPGFDALFDELLRVSRARFGEAEEGKLLLKRGMQYVNNGKYNQALQCLGKTRTLLAKEETLHEHLQASMISAYACIRLNHL